MAGEVEDEDLLRMLVGEEGAAFLAGVRLPILLNSNVNFLRNAGLDELSANRLSAAAEIARRYSADLADQARLHLDSPSDETSLSDLLRAIGIPVLED